MQGIKFERCKEEMIEGLRCFSLILKFPTNKNKKQNQILSIQQTSRHTIGNQLISEQAHTRIKHKDLMGLRSKNKKIQHLLKVIKITLLFV